MSPQPHVAQVPQSPLRARVHTHVHRLGALLSGSEAPVQAPHGSEGAARQHALELQRDRCSRSSLHQGHLLLLRRQTKRSPHIALHHLDGARRGAWHALRPRRGGQLQTDRAFHRDQFVADRRVGAPLPQHRDLLDRSTYQGAGCRQFLGYSVAAVPRFSSLRRAPRAVRRHTARRPQPRHQAGWRCSPQPHVHVHHQRRLRRSPLHRGHSLLCE